ncbi:hypothetical protein GALL_379580 [mine drainage metagenome]|uniref:Uncharacterized protein n=1 Tax=mine drainage metagenome TaxID=410659 RepID=A0A1J5Q9H2_9ZZZZ
MATAPLRPAGTLRSPMPSATGTQATSNSRNVDPEPQNTLVPSSEKRASRLPSKVVNDARKSRTSPKSECCCIG